MVILVDRPNTSICHNSPLEINIGQISALFLTAFSINKPGFCDRECVLECTKNIRFIPRIHSKTMIVDCWLLTVDGRVEKLNGWVLTVDSILLLWCSRKRYQALVFYSGSQKSEVCPMPYALCPMPYAQSYLIFLRKAIYLIENPWSMSVEACRSTHI